LRSNPFKQKKRREKSLGLRGAGTDRTWHWTRKEEKTNNVGIPRIEIFTLKRKKEKRDLQIEGGVSIPPERGSI